MGGINLVKRDLYLICGVIVLALALGIGIFLSESIQTGAWGLSFRLEGQPPVGPAGVDQLKQYGAASSK